MSAANAAPDVADSQGMGYLVSIPRRVVTIYAPIAAFLRAAVPVLLDGITAFKPNDELLSREGNPFWVRNPTLAHLKKLLFDTAYPDWLLNTILDLGGRDLPVDLRDGACRVRDRAASLPRLPLRRNEHLSRLPRAAVDALHSTGDDRLQAAASSTAGSR